MCDVKFTSERFLKSHVGIVHKDMRLDGDKNNSHFESTLFIDSGKTLSQEDNLDFNIINSDAQILPEWENSEYLENCNSKMLKCQVCSGEFDDEIIFKIYIESMHSGKNSSRESPLKERLWILKI